MPSRSIDLPTLATLIESLCPQCNPRQSKLSATNPHDPSRLRTLAAFCLTSRWANSLATPHLYHRPTCARWPLLARTLILRPDLAARVTHLCVEDWPGVAGDTLPPEVLSYWGDMVQNLTGDDTEVDPDDPELMNVGLDLLLPLCPNLEELDTVLDNADAFTFAQPGSLRSLRALAVTYADTEGGLDLGELSPLAAAAPNLSKILGHQVGGAVELHATFANVTHVCLDWSTLGPDCLRNILRACPRLGSFEFRAGGCSFGDEQFTPLEAQDAIVELAPRLKSLALDFAMADSFDAAVFGDEWIMSSVAGLEALERLDLDMRCLVTHKNPHVDERVRGPDGELVLLGQGPLAAPGAMALVDLLPSSICEVRVRQLAGGPEVAALAHSLVRLAEVAPGRFPKLRKVVVHETEHPDMKAAGRRFDEVSVEFRAENGSESRNGSPWESTID
ncbi:uncharacterized protein DNG_02178 [Cephalotrichum gorgonifer]|uniref:Uncharacterized protein n=1 Tax=Cephalotrichum gorgonifer TaxID=2041049 RepID=A0AAE8MSJ2_9PEZI|nr:uncharacterized protein DNG_02178 [Cephalotrichum gorgonifer]